MNYKLNNYDFMKTEKVTCIKASIDGATKDEKAAQVIEAAIELVRSMPDEAREGLAVALVTAAVMQECGAMPVVNAVELCEQIGVRVGSRAEKDFEEMV